MALQLLGLLRAASAKVEALAECIDEVLPGPAARQVLATAKKLAADVCVLCEVAGK